MNEAPIDENVVESLIRPKGTKAAKRKGKGKEKSNSVDEYEELKASTCIILDLMAQLHDHKQNEVDSKILMLDTTTVNEAQREIHAKMVEKVRSRRM